MKMPHNKSVLYRYLLSYFSVILLSCSVIAFFLFSASVRELNAEADKETQNKLFFEAADLENQQSIMSDIALSVATSIYYRPSYWGRNKYYEADLLDDFKKYFGRSPLVDDYFLMYQNDTWIFGSAAKSTFSVYAETVFSLSDSSDLYDTLNDISKFSVILPKETSSDWVLFAYPVNITSDCHACLCFVTHQSTLKSRLTDVAGNLSGLISIKYENQTIASLTGTSANLSGGGKVLSATSPESMFSVFITQPNSVYAGLDYFLWINAGILVLFIIAFLGLSAFLAYSNYRPIKKLALKYKMPDDSHIGQGDEIFHIDTLLKNAMEKQHVFQNNLHEQYLLIKRQQLLLLLSSGYGKDDVGQEILPDISFHGPYYCVLALRVTGSPKVASNKICQLIEELSGEGLTFYTVDLKEEKCYAVLIGLDDEMRQEEVVELVGAVLEASDIHFSLGLGKLYQDIKHMSASLTSALSACKTPHSNGLVRPNTKTVAGGRWYNDSPVIQMLAAIKTGNAEAAKAQLEIFFDETSISAPSLLIRYSIYADVINRLVQTSYEMELPLGKDYISTLLTTQDVFVLHDDMLVLISDLCEKYKEKNEHRCSETLKNILTYIGKHALEYDISQDKVAQHFHISNDRLYHIIKEGTGKTYKDYLMLLRIRQAQIFLVEQNFSVTKAGQCVGYPNISYFIKTFKRVTGYTPAIYKKMKEKS